MKKRKSVLYFLKTAVITILFCTAVYFENAQQQRLAVLVGLFVLFLSAGFGRSFLDRKGNMYCLSFIADIVLVYLLENNSRLLINYFLHSFYVIILLEAVLTLELKRGMAVGAAAVLISMIKYFYLVYYRFNLASVSQLSFFLLINILILVIAGFAQHSKEERERKDILYRELLDAHKQLRQYSDELRRLSLVEERNRIARDIHDTLGHNMTALIMQLQMAEHFLGEDMTKAGELLADSAKIAKDSLAGIREVVETLRGAVENSMPAEALKRLIDEFSARTRAEISLDISGEAAFQDMAVNAAVYHIIQEAVTNAVRHGKASKITVRLDYSKDAVGFRVEDNGIGAGDIKEGYGLKGIRERAEAFGGKVEFGACKGFYVKGFLNYDVGDTGLLGGRK